MKVKELIEKLSKLNPEAQVIMQKDAEGNGYSPLAGVYGNAIYVKENSFSGEVYDAGWSADDAGMSGAEWGNLLKRKRAVVFWPVN